ncbi:hypothetical protein OIO90_003863 [Microbotryomycetes sp. JL221]|nr:hypothetical protein OIO90_003863 [Microbotryomycetes sp. JL221]
MAAAAATVTAMDPTQGFQGLGLGDLGMPTNEHLPLPLSSPTGPDTRYSAFKSTRGPSSDSGAHAALTSGHSRFQASAAKPPIDLASTHPSTLRKHSLVATNGLHESISYPKAVPRDETTNAQSFEPTSSAPAPPSQFGVDGASVTSGKALKSRPSPIKVPPPPAQNASNPMHMFGPLLQKPFMQRLVKDKDSPAQNQSRTGRLGPVADESEAALTNTYDQHESIDAIKAEELHEAFEARIRKDSGYGGSISGPTPTVVPPMLPALQDEHSKRSYSGNESPSMSPTAQPPTSAKHSTRPQVPRHRRATSEDSPKVLQEATFRSFADVDLSEPTINDQATISFATRETFHAASPTLTSPTRAQHDLPNRSRHARSQSATILPARKGSAIPADAFMRPANLSQSGDATPVQSPTRHVPPSMLSNSRRPSVAPRPFDASNSVAISVKHEGKAEREVARAPLSGSDPVTVLMQSRLRPEDVEVGWNCSMAVDAQGQQVTLWSLTLKPKPASGYTSQGGRQDKRLVTPSTFLGYSLSTAKQGGTPIRNDGAITGLIPTDTSPMSELPHVTYPSQQSPFGIDASRRPSAAVNENVAFDPVSTFSASSDSSAGPATPQRPHIHTRDTIKASDLRSTGITGSKSPERVRRRLGGSDSSEDNIGDFQTTPRRPSAVKLSSQRQYRVLSPVRPYQKLQSGAEHVVDRDEEPKTPTRPTRPPTVGVTPPTPFVGSGGSDDAISNRATSGSDRSGGKSRNRPRNSVDDSDDTSSDLDVEDSRRQAELALARGQRRMMSKWSDTEGEETEDDDDRRKTSWSEVEDASTE